MRPSAPARAMIVWLALQPELNDMYGIVAVCAE
jgi:hypothetical protein